MLIVLVGVVVGIMDFGKAVAERSACRIWWGKVVSGLVIYSVGDVKVTEVGKDIVSDGLSWVGVEFLIGGDVGKMLLSLVDVKGGVHEAYSGMPLSKGSITKLTLEPSFRRVDLCCKVRLGLVVV